MDAGTKQDKNSPREKANPFSVLFFIWTLKIFKLGYSKDLEETDLFKPLKKDESLPLGDRLEKIWDKEKTRAKGKKPNLVKCIFFAFWFDFLKLALLSILTDLGLRMIEPQLVGCLLQYFKKNSTMPRNHAIGYAATLVISTFCKGLISNHFIFLAYHTGQRIRVACCALIYRKTLKISRTAFGSSAAGKVVNLLSNDVSRFDLICTFINSMWTGPLATIFIAILIYGQVGYSGFFGILIVFLVVPIQAFNGKLTSIFRLQTALKTDERIRVMSELLNGIRVIKMYAWEKPFAKFVTLARKYEIKIIRKTSYIRGIFMMFMLCTTRLAMFATLIAIVLLGGEIHVDKVFVITSYLSIISQIMSMMFIRGIAEIAESMVSIRRIRDYLLCEEFKNSNKFLTLPPPKAQDILQNPDMKLDKNDEYVISLEKFSARWPGSSESNGNNLDEISFKVSKGELVAIIGPVGSGKSSILQAILGELNPISGSIYVNSPSISYASQDPWVFSSSVRQNITFGKTYDSNRYSSVCRSCSLYPDFQQFSGGDLTIVGERGTSLSGGQKARINLARSVYRSGDIILLDDPLSAVDPHVANSLFHDCIINYLKGTTRILVTHQIQFIKECDRILILDNGRVHTYGSFDEIISQATFDSLICLTEDDDKDSDDQEVLTDLEHDTKIIDQKPKTTPKLLRQISRMSIKSQISLQNQENNEKIAALQREQRRELTSKGRFSGNTYVQYGKSAGNLLILTFVIILFLLSQVTASLIDFFVSYWSAREEYRLETNFNNRRIERSVPEIYSLESQETYMYIYTGLIVLLFIITFTRSMVYYTSCMRASRKLHDVMFEAVIRASVRFFDINPSGRILNRFTKDIGAIDELLPKAIMDASQIILMMLGALLLSVVINPYFLIPIIILFILFYYDRQLYLKTSKNIKRIEGVVKSPIFTHLNATLQGLTTIRAYGAQKTLSLEFDNHQNLHTSAWYMFISTTSAFGFSLDCFCVIYLLVIIVTFFVLMESGLVSNNDVGLAVSQSLMLTGYLQWGMRQSADVANQMMSVERVLEYMEIKPETNLEVSKTKASADWPNSGHVELKNVSLRYVENEEPVLKNLNIVINPKEKIGIVGRTGAGKSSLIGALFRLAPLEGEILIDGIDTSFISLQELRSRISIIPQEPVLFSGTMRKNIDPIGEYPDYILWKVLEEVELKDSLSSAGLDSRVDEGGANFSVGQRQLVCLARAILRNNKVLVLDEATANVDSNTDALIQQTIRTKFSNCTVITIAHRLHTIMDSDRIIVMDAGRVKEFASPYELLSNPESTFTSMVDQTGKQQRDLLIRIARETWLNKTQIYSAANELRENETKKEM